MNTPSAPVLVPGAPWATPRPLMAETELFDELPILVQAGSLEVLQEPPALTHHHQQAALAVVVLRVHPEVVGEGVDPLGEPRDLHSGGPGVVFVQPVLLDRRRLVVHLFGFPNCREGANLPRPNAIVKP